MKFHSYSKPHLVGWLGWFEDENEKTVGWLGLDNKFVFHNNPLIEASDCCEEIKKTVKKKTAKKGKRKAV